MLFLVLVTGCDIKKERDNASAKDNPENVSPSAEAQTTTPQQLQTVEADTLSFPQKRESTKQLQTAEADSIRSQYTQKPQTQEQSGIKVTFVELGSVNCIPCKMMQPIMKEIEKEYKNQVKVVFYDVWTEQGRPYAMKYGIRVIPTQVFLDKDGKEYFRHEGFFPKEQLVAVLKKQGVR